MKTTKEINNEQIFAFVLMPFDNKFDDIYQLGIKAAAAKLNIKAERVDDQSYREGILERIYRQIEVADIIIADMSTQNPNVFYEVGYAHAKEKICILLTSNIEDIPFDLKHKRHIVYKSTAINKLNKDLSKELSWAKEEIDNIKKSHIQASLSSLSGSLDKNKYHAKITLNFQINFTNESKNNSKEISLIYLFTSDGWSILQDNKPCPSKKSDIPPYKLMHILTMPEPKFVARNSWVQLSFQSKKIIANALSGEEIKDTYLIQGRTLLRLVTKETYFDYEFSIKINVDEMPF